MDSVHHSFGPAHSNVSLMYRPQAMHPRFSSPCVPPPSGVSGHASNDFTYFRHPLESTRFAGDYADGFGAVSAPHRWRNSAMQRELQLASFDQTNYAQMNAQLNAQTNAQMSVQTNAQMNAQTNAQMNAQTNARMSATNPPPSYDRSNRPSFYQSWSSAQQHHPVDSARFPSWRKYCEALRRGLDVVLEMPDVNPARVAPWLRPAPLDSRTQCGLDTSQMHSGLDTSQMQSGLDSSRMQSGLDTSRISDGQSRAGFASMDYSSDLRPDRAALRGFFPPGFSAAPSECYQSGYSGPGFLRDYVFPSPMRDAFSQYDCSCVPVNDASLCVSQPEGAGNHPLSVINHQLSRKRGGARFDAAFDDAANSSDGVSCAVAHAQSVAQAHSFDDAAHSSNGISCAVAHAQSVAHVQFSVQAHSFRAEHPRQPILLPSRKFSSSNLSKNAISPIFASALRSNCVGLENGFEAAEIERESFCVRTRDENRIFPPPLFVGNRELARALAGGNARGSESLTGLGLESLPGLGLESLPGSGAMEPTAFFPLVRNRDDVEEPTTKRQRVKDGVQPSASQQMFSGNASSLVSYQTNVDESSQQMFCSNASSLVSYQRSIDESSVRLAVNQPAALPSSPRCWPIPIGGFSSLTDSGSISRIASESELLCDLSTDSLSRRVVAKTRRGRLTASSERDILRESDVATRALGEASLDPFGRQQWSSHLASSEHQVFNMINASPVHQTANGGRRKTKPKRAVNVLTSRCASPAIPSHSEEDGMWGDVALSPYGATCASSLADSGIGNELTMSAADPSLSDELGMATAPTMSAESLSSAILSNERAISTEVLRRPERENCEDVVVKQEPIDGQMTVQIGGDDGVLDQATSTLIQGIPTIEQTTSTLQQAKPIIEQATPTIEQTTPTIEQATPTLQQATSTRSVMDVQFVDVCHNSPSVGFVDHPRVSLCDPSLVSLINPLPVGLSDDSPGPGLRQLTQTAGFGFHSTDGDANGGDCAPLDLNNVSNGGVTRLTRDLPPLTDDPRHICHPPSTPALPHPAQDGGWTRAPKQQQENEGGEEGESLRVIFRCTSCGYGGRTLRSLCKHRAAHAQANRVCAYCGYAFQRPSDLARHEHLHRVRGDALGGRSGGGVRNRVGEGLKKRWRGGLVVELDDGGEEDEGRGEMKGRGGRGGGGNVRRRRKGEVGTERRLSRAGRQKECSGGNLAISSHSLATPLHSLATPLHSLATPFNSPAILSHLLATSSHLITTPSNSPTTPSHLLATPSHLLAAPSDTPSSASISSLPSPLSTAPLLPPRTGGAGKEAAVYTCSRANKSAAVYAGRLHPRASFARLETYVHGMCINSALLPCVVVAPNVVAVGDELGVESGEDEDWACLPDGLLARSAMSGVTEQGVEVGLMNRLKAGDGANAAEAVEAVDTLGVPYGMPASMLDGMPDGVLGGMLDGIPDGVLGGMLDGMPDGVPGGMLDGIPDGVLGGMLDGIPDGVPGGMLDGMPDGVPGGMLDGIPDGVPGGMLDGMPDGVPGGMLDGIPDGVPGGMLDGIPDGVPGGMLDGMPDGVPGGMLDGMPDGVPGDMLDGMPDDKPDSMPDNSASVKIIQASKSSLGVHSVGDQPVSIEMSLIESDSAQVAIQFPNSESVPTEGACAISTEGLCNENSCKKSAAGSKEANDQSDRFHLPVNGAQKDAGGLGTIDAKSDRSSLICIRLVTRTAPQQPKTTEIRFVSRSDLQPPMAGEIRSAASVDPRSHQTVKALGDPFYVAKASTMVELPSARARRPSDCFVRLERLSSKSILGRIDLDSDWACEPESSKTSPTALEKASHDERGTVKKTNGAIVDAKCDASADYIKVYKDFLDCDSTKPICKVSRLPRVRKTFKRRRANGTSNPCGASLEKTGASGQNDVSPHQNEISKYEIFRESNSGKTYSRKTYSGKTYSEKIYSGKTYSGKTYLCDRCSYSTPSLRKYEQHERAHASARFLCKACSRACIKSSDLYRHWVTHNVKAPNGHYACDSCEFSAPSKDAVEVHMKRHYLLRPQLSANMQALGAMSRCGICQKSVLRSRLFDHKRTVHGRWCLKTPLNSPPSDLIAATAETDSNANDFKKCGRCLSCPNCERQFSSASYLLRHYFVSHQSGGADVEKVGASADSVGSTGKEMDDKGGAMESSCRCRFCAKELETVESLYAHEIEHILKTRSKNCIDSNRAFDTVDRDTKIGAARVDSNKECDTIHRVSEIYSVNEHSVYGDSNTAFDDVSKLQSTCFDSNETLERVNSKMSSLRGYRPRVVQVLPVT